MADSAAAATTQADIKRIFIEESKKHSLIYGAIKALAYTVETSSSKTCQGLIKDLDPTSEKLQAIALEEGDIINGKTVLTLKAVSAIYQNMVNKVVTSTDESLGINLIKEKIHE